ncbi:CDP-diacylglycerol--serine O-phosphatidyltransferase [Thiofilum flexile]|uniref:CDP-diacylglycerol--serine O-phosphatidyltransferase n=1 Tax=Thiofilum flexile TaxID=125627 RepID=UPI0003796B70|nr:CDP-diacylglycerol--serine O-phosphatidyltransferase [Thiofilum flexile]
MEPNDIPTLSEEEKRRRGLYILPNLFTTAALFAGFYSIVAAIQGKYELAAVAVFIAMILDGLDGRVARMTNTQSAFGAEYDSLADLVSFGLAPGLLMYQWALMHLKELGIAWGKAGWLVAFIYVACAALRLARFNTMVGKTDKRFFSGLPSPAAAALMIGTVWVFYDSEVLGSHFMFPALLITLTSGLLMVSNFSYYSFKDIDFRNKVPFVVGVLIILGLSLATIHPPTVIFTVFLVYAASGPVMWLYRRYKRIQRRKKGEEA